MIIPDAMEVNIFSPTDEEEGMRKSMTHNATHNRMIQILWFFDNPFLI